SAAAVRRGTSIIPCAPAPALADGCRAHRRCAGTSHRRPPAMAHFPRADRNAGSTVTGRHRPARTHPPARPDEKPTMTQTPFPPALPGDAPVPTSASGNADLIERVERIRDAVGHAFIGQADVLEQILIALLAGGHVLIEGVPGLGKTLLVRALAQAL